MHSYALGSASGLETDFHAALFRFFSIVYPYRNFPHKSLEHGISEFPSPLMDLFSCGARSNFLIFIFTFSVLEMVSSSDGVSSSQLSSQMILFSDLFQFVRNAARFEQFADYMFRYQGKEFFLLYQLIFLLKEDSPFHVLLAYRIFRKACLQRHSEVSCSLE